LWHQGYGGVCVLVGLTGVKVGGVGEVEIKFLGWSSWPSIRDRASCRVCVTYYWSMSRRSFSLATRYILSLVLYEVLWIFGGWRYGIEVSFWVHEDCRLRTRYGECCQFGSMRMWLLGGLCR